MTLSRVFLLTIVPPCHVNGCAIDYSVLAIGLAGILFSLWAIADVFKRR